MTEEWKAVPGYEGVYEVSNLGRVRSYKNVGHRNLREKPVILKGRHNCLYVNISLNGKTVNLHRLIATVFVPNPNNLPVVNHIDGNKHNNNANNLEWTTYSGNMQHALDNNLLGKCKAVLCTETGEIFRSVTELGKNIGLSQPQSSVIVRKGYYKGRHYKFLGVTR